MKMPVLAPLLLLLLVPARGLAQADGVQGGVAAGGDAVSGWAGAWSTRGAETLPPGRYAVEFRFGFPSSDVQFHVPINQFIEIDPWVSVDYLPLGSWTPTVGNTFGARLKVTVWNRGTDFLSLAFDIGLYLTYLPRNYDGGITGGFRVGAGELKYSHRFDNARLALITGVRTSIPLEFLNVYRSVDVALMFLFGFECRASDRVTFHMMAEPGVLVPIFRREAAFAVAFQMGFSYLW